MENFGAKYASGHNRAQKSGHETKGHRDRRYIWTLLLARSNDRAAGARTVDVRVTVITNGAVNECAAAAELHI